MNQQNQQPEEQNKEHRWDPELLKKGLKCDLDQCEMLKRCSDKKDITEWNDWRVRNPEQDIFLEGAPLERFHLNGIIFNNQNAHDSGSEVYLKKAKLRKASLENSTLNHVHLEEAKFNMAKLQYSDFHDAHVQGTIFYESEIQGADFHNVIVNGETSFCKCKVNRYAKNKKYTNFEVVSLDSCRIESNIKQLLEYNIRRKNWEQWYKEHKVQKWLVEPFWLISNYGISTKRIIFTFFGLAFVFAFLYRIFPDFVMVFGNVGDIRGFWHALYFSVVTMTTLGFGDIAANPDSWAGQTLLMVQVIFGYVLLGALVTRFAVLFTAGGPAGQV